MNPREGIVSRNRTGLKASPGSEKATLDNDGWELLVTLAEEVGPDDLVERFRRARDQELEHLRQVRKWVEEDVLGDASSA